jgi:hypothetical protein
MIKWPRCADSIVSPRITFARTLGGIEKLKQDAQNIQDIATMNNSYPVHPVYPV